MRWSKDVEETFRFVRRKNNSESNRGLECFTDQLGNKVCKLDRNLYLLCRRQVKEIQGGLWTVWGDKGFGPSLGFKSEKEECDILVFSNHSIKRFRID